MGTGLGKLRFCRLETPHLTIEQTTANAEEPKCQRKNTGVGYRLEIKQIAGQHPALARPLRIEFPGGLYHVTSRGDRREAIFL